MSGIKQIPLLSAVRALDDFFVEVTWKEGHRAPRTEKVDLGPLINSLKIFKPLRDNRPLFESVHLLDEMGDIIAWGDDETLEMDSGTIESLAEDMMTANDFRAFLFEMNYTQNTAAAMLGYTRRHIVSFVSGEAPIPRVCALATKALRQRKASPEAFIEIAASTERAAIYIQRSVLEDLRELSPIVWPTATRSLLIGHAADWTVGTTKQVVRIKQATVVTNE